MMEFFAEGLLCQSVHDERCGLALALKRLCPRPSRVVMPIGRFEVLQQFAGGPRFRDHAYRSPGTVIAGLDPESMTTCKPFGPEELLARKGSHAAAGLSPPPMAQ
jgi:hypothetical protein